VSDVFAPCGHEPPQGNSQLHGVCVFCYRDRLGKAQAEVARLRAALEYASEMASWHTDDEAREDDETPKDMAAHISGLIRQRCKSALAAQQEVERG